ncbi:hypothetical protein Hte_006241 [Hypoxylon texense]
MSTTSRAVWWRQIRFFTTLTTAPATRTSRSQTTTLPSSLRSRNAPPLNRRFQSTKPPNPNPNPTAEAGAGAAGARQARRADAILRRASRWVPPRLRPALARLRAAPLSHAAAFLVLHELTAIGPLVGLAYAFHRADWVPTAWVLGPWAAWAEEGLRRYARYFREKGWWFGMGMGGDGDEDEAAREGEERLEERLREEVRLEKERQKEGREGSRGGWWGFWRKKEGDIVDDAPGDGEKSKSAKAWHTVKNAVTVDHTEKGYKIGIQIAAAYAITKLLLIPRIALSLWATPWLARGFIAARRSIWRKRP